MSNPALAVTRFVILAVPRTGSNWLCSLLGSHPDILCHHEVFNPAGTFYALAYRNGGLDLGTLEERNARPLDFLDRVWRNPLGFRCVGFKMTRGQDERVVQAVLEDRQIRKIVLRRRNVLRTYVSELIARQTSQWENSDRADLPIQPPRVRIDAEELREHMAVNNAFYARIEQALVHSRQEFFPSSYERLFSNDEHAQLLRFLDVPPHFAGLKATSIRPSAGHLRELVTNYDELALALRDSEWAPLLLAEDQVPCRDIACRV